MVRLGLAGLMLAGCASTPEGLVARFPLDKGASTRRLIQAGQQPGAPPAACAWTAGMHGEVLAFSGKPGLALSRPIRNVDLKAGFTMATWIKAPPERQCERTVLALGEPGRSHFLRVVVTPTGLIKLGLAERRPVGCGVVDDGQWHHVALAYNGRQLKVYLDDLFQGQPLFVLRDIPKIQPVSARLGVCSGVLSVGALPDGSAPFRGALQDLMVFNRELSGAEIAKLAHADPRPAAAPAPRPARDPLITDPVWKSCKDGCMLYNPKERNWWYFFMQIRPYALCDRKVDVADHHGTSIGVSVSDDGGRTWRYRGNLKGLDRHDKVNSLWAPDALWDEASGKFHLFITYVEGVPASWQTLKTINHYTSEDLMHWSYVKSYQFCRMNIDCHVHRLPDGLWGMWFKDEIKNETGFAVGQDLYSFQYVGAAQMDQPLMLEGAEVFTWHGYYWLTGDNKQTKTSCAVFRSRDGRHWTRQPDILAAAEERGPFYGPDGGHHPEVVPVDDQTAYVFYWCSSREDHPQFQYGVTNVRPLRCEHGRLRVDHQAPEVDLKLPCPLSAEPIERF